MMLFSKLCILCRSYQFLQYFALKALKALPPTATYTDWHAAITPTALPSASYPQSPQLVGTAAARKRPVFG